MTADLVTYTVSLAGPDSTYEVDVPTFQGPEAAARRAQMAVWHAEKPDDWFATDLEVLAVEARDRG